MRAGIRCRQDRDNAKGCALFPSAKRVPRALERGRRAGNGIKRRKDDLLYEWDEVFENVEIDKMVPRTNMLTKVV